MFIISIITLIFGIIGLTNARVLMSLISVGGFFSLNGIIAVVTTALLLCGGIMGILFAKRGEKAGLFVIIGIVLVAATAVNFVVVEYLSDLVPRNIISLTAPILFLVGALFYKKSA